MNKVVGRFPCNANQLPAFFQDDICSPGDQVIGDATGNPATVEAIALTVVDRVLDLAGFDVQTYRWGK